MIRKDQLVTSLTTLRLVGLFTIFAMAALSHAQPASAGELCQDVFIGCVTECADVEGDECDAGSPHCPGVLQCGEDDGELEELWCVVSLPD